MCQSVKRVRGKSPQLTHARTRRLFPPEKKSLVDNEILTETPSVRLSARILDEFHKTHLKSERSGPPSEQQPEGYCGPASLSVYCYSSSSSFFCILKGAANVPGISPQCNVRTAVMRGASASPLIDRQSSCLSGLSFTPPLHKRHPDSQNPPVNQPLQLFAAMATVSTRRVKCASPRFANR